MYSFLKKIRKFKMKHLFSSYMGKRIEKIKNNSFYKGVMKGYKVPTLPKKIELILNNVYIRILRFIGGLCLLLILTSSHLSFPMYLQFIIVILGCLQSIQIMVIFVIKFIYGIYTLIYKAKDFEVRNSPLNQLATHLAKFLYCVKIGCVMTAGTATFIAGGGAFD